ncbi:MAG: hypothetical protein IT445_02780 [Phycisphaeraceae bacterium]|nr:hypothetical protein [Phycisphaeraceae bacterium]
MKSRKRIWIATSALAVAGCVSATRIAPPVSELQSGAAFPQQLERGRRLYLGACGSCHAPYAIDEYSLAQWDRILPEMVRKTKLDASDTDALRTYIVASHEYLAQTAP